MQKKFKAVNKMEYGIYLQDKRMRNFHVLIGFALLMALMENILFSITENIGTIPENWSLPLHSVCTVICGAILLYSIYCNSNVVHRIIRYLSFGFFKPLKLSDFTKDAYCKCSDTNLGRKSAAFIAFSFYLIICGVVFYTLCSLASWNDIVEFGHLYLPFGTILASCTKIFSINVIFSVLYSILVKDNGYKYVSEYGYTLKPSFGLLKYSLKTCTHLLLSSLRYSILLAMICNIF